MSNDVVYCGNCGYSNPQTNKFCGNCGSALSDNETKSINTQEREFRYFEWKPQANRGYEKRIYALTAFATRDSIGGAFSESEARREYWERYQHEILEGLQPFLNQGWQPASEIGPAAINVELASVRAKNSLFGALKFFKDEWVCVGATVRLIM